MVNVSLLATVIQEVELKTTQGGVSKALFAVESADSESAPLKFQLAAFGRVADRAANLAVGDMAFFFGKMTASPVHKTISIALSNFELVEDSTNAEPR